MAAETVASGESCPFVPARRLFPRERPMARARASQGLMASRARTILLSCRSLLQRFTESAAPLFQAPTENVTMASPAPPAAGPEAPVSHPRRRWRTGHPQFPSPAASRPPGRPAPKPVSSSLRAFRRRRRLIFRSGPPGPAPLRRSSYPLRAGLPPSASRSSNRHSSPQSPPQPLQACWPEHGERDPCQKRIRR